ncbi:MAG: CCA tRNA nucleotidyltransferase, partial [Patescibacteria group bacterium]|nr:CCA tRNA nucleotidyltransferase [Patescibacteria group bacterium]
WIPASAGMTARWIPASAGMTARWIPASAGMTARWIPASAGMTPMIKEELKLNRELTGLEIAAREVIKKLRAKKHGAYFAGGYVRDIKLGLLPHDIDIATSAKPNQIEKLFKKTVPTGKAFGVIRVREKGHWFEVATFRIDLPDGDARRPGGVKFTSAKEDAKRRDFTVNALFYDSTKEEIIDYVGGLEDLKKKELKFIGSAQKRINEDNLRLLRAVRFKTALGFKMSKKDLDIIKKNKEKIQTVSAERIREELTKMLVHPNRAKAMKELKKLGLLKEILPEIQKMVGVKQPEKYHSEGDVWVHTLLALEHLPDNVSPEVAWAVLLHDVGKPPAQRTPEKHGVDRIRFSGHENVSAKMAKEITRRLKFSRKQVEKITWIVKNHMRLMHIQKMKKAKQRRLLQHPYFDDFMIVSYADIAASLQKGKPNFKDYDYAMKLLEEEEKRPKEEKKKKIISGHDIMKHFKIKSGPHIGKILEMVHDAYLEGKVGLDKKEILKFIKKNCYDFITKRKHNS